MTGTVIVTNKTRRVMRQACPLWQAATGDTLMNALQRVTCRNIPTAMLNCFDWETYKHTKTKGLHRRKHNGTTVTVLPEKREVFLNVCRLLGFTVQEYNTRRCGVTCRVGITYATYHGWDEYYFFAHDATKRFRVDLAMLIKHFGGAKWTITS